MMISINNFIDEIVSTKYATELTVNLYYNDGSSFGGVQQFDIPIAVSSGTITLQVCFHHEE